MTDTLMLEVDLLLPDDADGFGTVGTMSDYEFLTLPGADGTDGLPGADGTNLPPGGTPDFWFATSSSGGVLYVDPFRTPGGTAVIRTPEQHGAPADNVADDTAAVQAACDYVHGRGGGVVLLTGPYYRFAGVKLRSGTVIRSLSGQQKMVGAGNSCSVRGPAGWAGGWLIDTALEQTVVITGSAPTDTYTLTGGYGGTATTTAISLSDSVATVQTKIRALPGLSSTLVTGIPTSYTIALGDDVGAAPVSGALTPGTLVAAVTAGTPTVTVKRIRVESAGVEGFGMLGITTSGATPSSGAIRARHTNKFRVDGVSSSFTNLGTAVVGGGAATITRCGQQNFAFTAPAFASGTVTLYGADHWVSDCELDGGVANGTGPVDATNLYHCALAVMSDTTTVVGGIAQFGDCGIYVGGSHGVYVGARADLNAGHGIYEAAYAVANQYTSTRLLSNGQAADNTYDGMNLNGINHRVSGAVGVSAANALTTNRMRFVVFDNDVTTDRQAAIFAKSELDGISGDVNCWGTDLYSSVLTRPAWQANAGVPSARPPSRYMAGRWWFDTTNGRDTKSTGTKWVDRFGENVGNVLPFGVSTMRATNGWQAALGTCTVARVDGHAGFKEPWCLEVTVLAAGVTAGYAAIASSGLVTLPAVDPGRPYVDAAHAYGPAGATISFQTTWKDSGGTNISSTTPTTPVAIGTTDTSAFAGPTPDSPDTAAKVQKAVYFTRAGLTAGDKFYLTRVDFRPGTTPSDPEYA